MPPDRNRQATEQCGGKRGSSGAQAVAGTAHRVDQAIVSGGMERLAQAPDVHVDRAFLNIDVIAPHLVEELRPRVDAARVREQKMQQAELRGRQRYALV